MDIPKVTKRFETSLASSLSAAGTSFTLESATDEDGNALSGLYGMTIDVGNSNVEDFIVTISGTTATVVYRGIDADAPNTEVTANKQAHRRGAPVVITDYPILAVLRLLANGDEAFPNPLKYATGIGPVSADDLVDKAYADALLGGGTLSYDRVILAGTAGETVASGNLVYLKVSDGRWWKCDADTAATVENVTLGIAQGSGTAGVAITGGVLIKGLATNMSGLTANTKYYASNTAGAVSSSAGTVEVSVGFALSTTSLLLDSRFDQQITEDQQDALAGGGNFGTPSASNQYITQDYNKSATGLPVVNTYTANSLLGSSTTRFDVTNISGSTYRYTYDGTGTDPSINSGTLPIGSVVDIQGQNFAAGNKGMFVTTGVGSNYFEITNASGVAENDKTLGTGYLSKGTTWTKPSTLKYVIVEMVGGGGSGGSTGANENSNGGGGGGGGYSKKKIAAASLGSTESLVVGPGAVASAAAAADGRTGSRSVFGAHLSSNGGAAGLGAGGIYTGGAGGTASSGDLNIPGEAGQDGASTMKGLGRGGSSRFGYGGKGVSLDGAGTDGSLYGGGGSGAYGDSSSSAAAGGVGAAGIIIVTEYYS